VTVPNIHPQNKNKNHKILHILIDYLDDWLILVTTIKIQKKQLNQDLKSFFITTTLITMSTNVRKRGQYSAVSNGKNSDDVMSIDYK
jgi:hypothetical protein